jgi:hypothetical protein
MITNLINKLEITIFFYSVSFLHQASLTYHIFSIHIPTKNRTKHKVRWYMYWKDMISEWCLVEKAYRIKKNSDFQFIYKKGKSVANRQFVISTKHHSLIISFQYIYQRTLCFVLFIRYHKLIVEVKLLKIT